MKNKSLIVIISIVLLFIITNPSTTAFKNYLGKTSYYGLKRSLNLFVVSEYEDRGNDYLGVLGNFLWLNKPSPVNEKNYRIGDSAKMDSVKVDVVNKQWQPPVTDKEVVTNSYWSEETKKSIKEGFMNRADLKVLKPKPRSFFCDCYINELEKRYPGGVGNKISDSETSDIGKMCADSVKLHENELK